MTEQIIYEAVLPRIGDKKDPNDHRGTGEISKALSQASPVKYNINLGIGNSPLQKVAPQTQEIDTDLKNLCSRLEYAICKLLDLEPGNNFIHYQVLENSLSRSFWSGLKNKLFLLKDNGLKQFVEKDVHKQFKLAFGDILNWSEIQKAKPEIEDDEKFDLSRMAYSLILDFLKAYRQGERLEYIVDMYATSPRLELDEERVRIVLTHRPFLENKFDERHVADFKEHFPSFVEILAFIVASRFAVDRKHSYLWLWADSDFGKGFLSGILSKLGCVIETSEREVQNLFAGQPIGKAPEDFKRAMVLLIDEPKSVKGELKQLQSSIQLSPKFQLSARVEIYCKLFTSKEKMRGLINEGVVEDQFANRFNIIEGKGSLAERPLFKAEKPAYTRSIQGYVAMQLNTLVSEYQSLGQEAAELKADAQIEVFRKKYRVSKTYKTASQNLPSLAKQFVQWLAGQTVRSEFTISGSVSGKSLTVVRTPTKAFEVFVESEYGKYDQKAIGFQQDAVMNHIKHPAERDQFKINGQTLRGVQLNDEFKTIFDAAQRR